MSNRGIFIRGRKKYECEEMKKCISDDGSRVTYFFTVAHTFLPPSSLLPLFTNTFPRFSAPPCTPSPLLFSEEARTCHGKTLSSTRIKQVIAHGTKLFPRCWLRFTVLRTVSVSKDRPPNRRNALPGLCARIASRKYQKFLD